jgi:hypothetical protein
MIATLKFNLDDHHQRNEHKRCINATKAYIVLHEFMYTELRNLIKYNGDSYSEETIRVVDELRSKLNNLMEENGIDLNDLE